jgi:hypothetical protein
MKKIKISYWVFILLFAVAMLFSAIGGIKPSENSIKFLHDGLGYPIYFIRFISIAKLLGVIAILIPGLKKLKEWAYAGLFFDLAGAVYSGIAVAGAFDPKMIFLLIWIIPGILSYYYWQKKNEGLYKS